MSMRTLISNVRPSGHFVIVRLPEGATFRARYADDPEPRDITALVTELLLTGALDVLEARASERPAPVDAVEAVTVFYSEPGLPGQVREPASFTWVHGPTREGGDFGPHEVLDLIARGVTVELTAGVAREATEELTEQDWKDVQSVPTEDGDHREASPEPDKGPQDDQSV